VVGGSSTAGPDQSGSSAGIALLGAALLGTPLLGAALLGAPLLGTALLGAALLGTALLGTAPLGVALVGAARGQSAGASPGTALLGALAGHPLPGSVVWSGAALAGTVLDQPMLSLGIAAARPAVGQP
jgi:hypothetical protein